MDPKWIEMQEKVKRSMDALEIYNRKMQKMHFSNLHNFLDSYVGKSEDRNLTADWAFCKSRIADTATDVESKVTDDVRWQIDYLTKRISDHIIEGHLKSGKIAQTLLALEDGLQIDSRELSTGFYSEQILPDDPAAKNVPVVKDGHGLLLPPFSSTKSWVNESLFSDTATLLPEPVK